MQLLVLVLLPAVALCQITGGITNITLPADSEPVVFAVRAINEYLDRVQHGEHYNQQLVEVVRAGSQVVAGQMLYLTLHLTSAYYCDITVWYRSWLTGDDRLQVMDGPNCTRHLRLVRTGEISQEMPLPLGSSQPDDVAVLKALDFAACSVNDAINSAFAYVLGSTSAVTYTKQVTSGMTYRFHNVDLRPSDCHNGGCSNLDLSACHVSAQGGMVPIKCNFVVQYQAWTTPQYTLSDMHC